MSFGTETCHVLIQRTLWSSLYGSGAGNRDGTDKNRPRTAFSQQKATETGKRAKHYFVDTHGRLWNHEGRIVRQDWGRQSLPWVTMQKLNLKETEGTECAKTTGSEACTLR